MEVVVPIILLIAVTIFATYNTYLYFTDAPLIIDGPWWVMWLIVLGLFIFIIVFINIRKRLLKQLQQSITDKAQVDLNLGEHEYFLQTPIYLFHSLKIPIFNNDHTPLSYEIKYDTILNKYASALSTIFVGCSLEIESPQHKVYLKSHFFTVHYGYDVYLDDEKIGTFKMKKLIGKDSGIKQQLPYQFCGKDFTYNLHNPYMSQTTDIKDEADKVVMKARRSFLDMSKHKLTKQRGEKHEIEFFAASLPVEVFLGLYVIAILNKNIQR
ncbi:hypothetical protein [Staphylococcus massiliensis]|uniref:Uncharacterized protein n=1 Tax=Staphylococcus massiliensis S46 TaxID=1229783 RepID=K9AWX9_9STAP|nr:hypothetical protein [Staphylococcus massiliensis]EKU47077.1 hypothetical protein C273_08221 [Staphylococcus massiliensis S46]MCG3398629.1 hypothetical protein [Staphylococcus massiliensis]MCG3401191.1 hypothetical protein [Staphylococcus massiliensis]MCG3412330.1 hypothetical protein [Staphylococcus massiliensis]PNZ98514.1 hypothetical protein CD133_08405 [Staphylococcus massiliensis CCUG 55927]